MSIRNIDLLIHDDQTVMDILEDLDDLSLVIITDGAVFSSYAGEDIDWIDAALLKRRVQSCRVCRNKITGGYCAEIEVKEENNV